MSNRWMAPAAISLGIVVVVAPVGVLSNYQLGILTLVVSFMVAALAQNLLAGFADIPSLGNVAFFAISAYTSANLITLGHVPTALALLVGVLAAGTLGLIVGLPALRISGMHLAIITVALVFVARELMDQWDASHAEASSGVTVTTPGWLLSEPGLYIAAVLAAVITYVATWNLLRSRSGRAILALSDSPHAAAASGIAETRIRLAAFVISGLITGIAGAIYLYVQQTVTPAGFPLDLSLAFLTMMIVGGSRSLGGSILGALIIGLLPQFLRLFPAQIGAINVLQSVYGLYAVLLLATLRFFPEGLWNVAAGWVQDRMQTPERGAPTPEAPPYEG